MKIVKMLLLLWVVFLTASTYSMTSSGGAESVSDSSSTSQAEDCCICRFPMDDPQLTIHGKQIFASPPCSQRHCFHERCINAWFEARGGETTCPLCRSRALSEQDRNLIAAARAGNINGIHEALATGAHLAVNEYEVFKTAAAQEHFNIICHFINDIPHDFDWQSLAPARLLAYAIMHNEREAIRLLEQRGIIERMGAIIEFLTHHDFATAQRFIEQKKWLRTVFLLSHEEFQDIMFRMISDGNMPAVQWLYQSYPGCYRDVTPLLRLAILSNRLEITQYLAAQCHAPAILAHYLQLAGQAGHVAIVQFLIETVHITANSVALLIEATKAGRLDVVRYLCTRPETHTHFSEVLYLALRHPSDDHRAIVHYLVTHHLNSRDLLRQATMPQVSPRRLDLTLVKHLVEMEHVDQLLVDEAAALALEHQREDIAEYLIGERHARMPFVFLMAQQQNLSHAITLILERHRDELDLHEALTQATESGNLHLYTLVQGYSHSDQQAQLQTLFLAAKRANVALVNTILAQCPYELLVRSLRQAVSLGLTALIDVILTQLDVHGQRINLIDLLYHTITTTHLNILQLLVARYPDVLADAHIHRDLLYHAARIGNQPAIQFLIEDCHFTGPLDEVVRWARRYDNRDLLQYIIAHYADRIDIPLLALWARGIGDRDLEELTLVHDECG